MVARDEALVVRGSIRHAETRVVLSMMIDHVLSFMLTTKNRKWGEVIGFLGRRAGSKKWLREEQRYEGEGRRGVGRERYTCRERWFTKQKTQSGGKGWIVDLHLRLIKMRLEGASVWIRCSASLIDLLHVCSPPKLCPTSSTAGAGTLLFSFV